MYTKWAKKLGYKGRVVEKHSSTNGGITSATIEFEFAFAYGYLSGETGVHYLTSSQNVSDLPTVKISFCSLYYNFAKWICQILDPFSQQSMLRIYLLLMCLVCLGQFFAAYIIIRSHTANQRLWPCDRTSASK